MPPSRRAFGRLWSLVLAGGLLIGAASLSADEPPPSELEEGWIMAPDAAVVELATVEGTLVLLAERASLPAVAALLEAPEAPEEKYALENEDEGQRTLVLLRDPEIQLGEHLGEKLRIRGEAYALGQLAGIIARAVEVLEPAPDS